MIHASTLSVLRTAFLGALVGGVAIVAPRDAAAEGPPPPPAEAYAACQSKQAGDACGVRIHDNDMKGTCVAHPSDGRLFCRPDRPPAPPPEAFDACNGKKVADACSVQFHGHQMDGTCIQTPDSRLVCAPPHPPGPPPEGPPTR